MGQSDGVKLWKSHGHIDNVRRTDPHRVMGEILAQLVAMVIQHRALLLGCWGQTERSLTKAAAVVRDHALPIALTVWQPRRLRDALTTRQRCLQTAGKITHRRTHPSLPQLLVEAVDRCIS